MNMDFFKKESELTSVIKSTDRFINNCISVMIAEMGVDSLLDDENNRAYDMLKQAIELKNETNALLINYDERFIQMEKNQQEILNMLKDYQPKLENIDKQTRNK